jgi:DNA-binding SARP family transcriptional activator
MSQQLVRCAVLGRAEIATPGIRLTPESERQFGLALYFCVNAGRAVPRDEVAQMFWPEHGIEAARHCLRQTLYRVRALGVPVRSGAKTSTLDAECVETDYGPAAADGAPASVYLALADVSVLPGYGPRFSTPFAEWAERFRSDLGSRIRRGLVRAIADARSRGRYADVDRLARHCLALDPLNEEATLALAEAVALVGAKVEAVGMIDRYVAEVGGHPDLRIPAEVLRARVSELLYAPQLTGGPTSPFVGRDDETEELLTLFALSRHGTPQFACLLGDAGVGKTALADHVLRILAFRHCSIIRVSCQQLDAERALSVLAQLVARLFRVRGALGASAETLSMLQNLTVWAPREALISGPEQYPLLQLSQLRFAFEDLVDAVVHESPLIIFVDDIHWIDARSLAFLIGILQHDAHRELMLIACARAQVGPIATELSSASRLRYRQFRIGPLPASQATTLLRHLLRPAKQAVTDDHIRELVDLAGGNPLFLSQLARHMLEVGGQDPSPNNLRALVNRRLQTLGQESLLTLQACSCLGTHATLRRLECLLEMPSHVLMHSLSQLEEAGMVQMQEDTVRCRHELFLEAARDATPSGVKTMLHGRAARVMEKDARLSADPMLLWQSAEHNQMAFQQSDARRVLQKLGNYLMRIGTPSDASQAFERAMVYCDTWEEQLALIDRILVAHRASRDWRAILQTLERRRQFERALHRDPNPNSAHQLLELEARFRLSEDLGSELGLALNQLETSDFDSSNRAPLLLMGLVFADNTINLDAALRIRKLLPDDEASLARDDTLRAANLVFHTAFGSLDIALHHAAEIQRQYAALATPDVRNIQRLRWSAIPLLYAGRFRECEDVLTLAVEHAKRRFLWTEAGTAAGLLADAALYRSDIAMAARHVDAALSFANRTNDEPLRSDIRGLAATVALLLGDLPGARLQFAEAVYHRSQRPERRLRARSLGLKLAVQWDDSGIADSDVEELQVLVSGATPYAEFDFIVCVLLRLLRTRATRTARLQFLAEYRGARRERFSIPTVFLRTLCPDLAVPEDDGTTPTEPSGTTSDGRIKTLRATRP